MSNYSKKKEQYYSAALEQFKQGISPWKIAKNLGLNKATVYRWLRNELPDYRNLSDIKRERLDFLFKEYVKVYEPFKFSKKDMCSILDCKIEELEAMLYRHKLSHQRLQTYHGQATFCNVAKEFRNRVSAVVAKSKGEYKSVRDYVVQAVSIALLYDEEE